MQALDFEQNSYIWMGPGRSIMLHCMRVGVMFNGVGISAFNAKAQEYAGWHLEITDLINGTDAFFMTALNGRHLLESWVVGCIGLIGDAAHVIMPFHVQGAAQSIEDSWVLFRCLEEATEGEVRRCIEIL